MKKHQKKYVTWGVILLLVVGGIFFLRSSNAEGAEAKEQLAKCLTDKGAKFYGAYWCPHCNNQKALFGNAAKFIPYIECADPANQGVQNPVCTDEGITGYPTWTFEDGSQLSGEVPLEKLASQAGCKY